MDSDYEADSRWGALATSLSLRDHALAHTPVGVTITELRARDHPIIYCNPGFERLTGYSQDQVLERNCRFLQGDEPGQAGLVQIRKALRTESDVRVVLRNYRADGSLFWNELYVTLPG